MFNFKSLNSSILEDRKEFEDALNLVKDMLLSLTVSNNEFELEYPVNGKPTYVLVMNVPQSVTNKKVDIEYDEAKNRISISYSAKLGEASTTSMALEKPLPVDSNPETLSAVVVNGVLTVTVEQDKSKLAKELSEESSAKVNIRRVNR